MIRYTIPPRLDQTPGVSDAKHMPFRQFSDLVPGDLFTEHKVLHVKIEPLGASNAIILTGLSRGQAVTVGDAEFVDAVAAKENRVLDYLVDRAEGRTPPNFHPDYQPTAPGEGYFVGPDGFAYAYGAITRHIQRGHSGLLGAPAHAQLRALGLEEQIERGETPYPIPSTFY